MNKGTDKAERTRQLIIEKTAILFNKKGFAGTSMSDLTEATGLTKGSIYGNFENKEDVAVAVFEYNTSKIIRQAQQLIDDAPDYHSKLMVYGKVYKNILKLNEDQGGCPILNTATEADDTNPVLRQKVAEVILNWRKKLIQLIEGGIKAGEFKSSLQPRQIAVSIIALIEGGIMIAKATNDQYAMDNVLETVELLINQLEQ